MAVTLIKETGAIVASANSYADATDAASFNLTAIGGSAWTASGTTNDDAHLGALIQASATLDDLCEWPGFIQQVGQPMRWPRAARRYIRGPGAGDGVYPIYLMPDYIPDWSMEPGIFAGDEYIRLSTVPVRVVRATCELARLMLGGFNPLAEPADDGSQESIKVGPIEIKERQPVTFGNRSAELNQSLPNSVIAILRPILPNIGARGGQARTVVA